MLCQKCAGSGKYMGIGFIQVNCNCDEYVDNAAKNNDNKSVQIDKRSKSYKDAIRNIMVENNVDRDEAMKLFDEEFYKLA